MFHHETALDLTGGSHRADSTCVDSCLHSSNVFHLQTARASIATQRSMSIALSTGDGVRPLPPPGGEGGDYEGQERDLLLKEKATMNRRDPILNLGRFPPSGRWLRRSESTCDEC